MWNCWLGFYTTLLLTGAAAPPGSVTTIITQSHHIHAHRIWEMPHLSQRWPATDVQRYLQLYWRRPVWTLLWGTTTSSPPSVFPLHWCSLCLWRETHWWADELQFVKVNLWCSPVFHITFSNYHLSMLALLLWVVAAVATVALAIDFFCWGCFHL